MKKYLAPEFEEVKYDVKDCLATSGGDNNQADANNMDDNSDLF